MYKALVNRAAATMVAFAVMISPLTYIARADAAEISVPFSHSAYAKPFSATGEYAPDEVIVKFKPSVSSLHKSSVRSSLELTKEENVPLAGAELMTIPQNETVESVIASLQASGTVEYAQPNYIYRTATNDTYWDQQWGLHNTGQTIAGNDPGSNDVDMDVPEAWTNFTGLQEVVVAVIDTGVDIHDPDLQANIWTNPGETPGDGIDNDHNGYVDDIHGWDFANHDNTVYDALDFDIHGTHVAGTIAAVANNGTGISGAAPNVKIMPLKFMKNGTGFTVGAIEAINYAAKMGVKISNNSWAGNTYDALLNDAIVNAGKMSDMVFVAAAGNQHSNNDNLSTPVYPANSPADNIISVAAVDNNGALADFSNYGAATVDVAAPGVNILSTFPIIPNVTSVVYNGTSTYQTLTVGFGVQELTSTSAENFMKNALTDYFGLGAPSSILLVDDDESDRNDPLFPDFKSTFQSILASAGFTNITTTTVATGSELNSALLTGKSAVIWFTGHAFDNNSDKPLRDHDISALQNYLNAGGKLLLTGEDAISGNLNHSFVSHTLGVDPSKVDPLMDGATNYRKAGGYVNTPSQGMLFDFANPSGPRGFDHMYEKNADVPTASEVICYVGTSDYDYAFLDGTSMAAPHVAALAAVMLGKYNLTYKETIDFIKSSGTSLASLSGKTVTGKMVNMNDAMLAVAGSPIPHFAPAYPKTGTVTHFSAVLNAQSDKIATAYYVALANNATAPTSSEVQAGSAAGKIAGGSFPLTANTPGSAVVTGLSETTDYDIYVVLKDGSYISEPAKLHVKTTVSHAIADFEKTSQSAHTASFSWTAANGAASLIIEQSSNGGASWTTSATGAIANNATMATVAGLDPNSAYNFRLVVSGGVNVGNSNVVDVTTDAIAVSDFTYTGYSDTTASFTWTSASHATGIKLEQSSNGGAAWTAAATGAIANNAATAAAAGLAGSTAYKFRLVVTGGWNAGNSNTVDVMTSPDVTPPVFPSPYPQLGTVTSTSAQVSFRINESGKVYYVLVPDGAAAPTSVQVKSGQGGGGVAALVYGQFPFVFGGNGTVTVTLQNLTASTSYDIYLVAEDGISNLQSSPVKLDISTPSGQVTGPAPFIPGPPPASGLPPTNAEPEPKVTDNGSNGVSVEPPKPTTGKDADGKATQTYEMNNKTLEDAFHSISAKNEEAQKISIPVQMTDGQAVKVELPADAISKAAKDTPNATIAITSSEASYNLPVSALDIAGIAKNLGAETKDLKINVRMEKVTGSLAAQIEQKAQQSGIKLVGSPIDFSITATANGQSRQINDFGQTYVTRTIVISETVDGQRASVVMYDPATGEMTFVPAVFTIGADGKTQVTIKRNGNSIYTVMKNGKTFHDIQTHWAKRDIELLASKALLKGMAADKFDPEGKITRAQFAVMLAQALGLTKDAGETPRFSDFKASDWFAGYVGAAVKAKLIQGFDNGNFRPNDKITREQMAVMIANAVSFAGKSEDVSAKKAALLAKFSDMPSIHVWAQESIAETVDLGMMQGLKADRFAPGEDATRAQAAAIIKRVLVYLQFINE